MQYTPRRLFNRISPAEDKTPAGLNFASFPEDTQPPRVFPDIRSTRRRSYPSPRPGGAGTERRKHPRPAAAPAKPAAGQKQRSRRRNRSSRTPTEAQPAQLDPPRPVCIEGHDDGSSDTSSRTPAPETGTKPRKDKLPRRKAYPDRTRSTAAADRKKVNCFRVFPPQIPSPSRPRRPALLLYINIYAIVSRT